MAHTHAEPYAVIGAIAGGTSMMLVAVRGAQSPIIATMIGGVAGALAGAIYAKLHALARRR